MPEFEAGTSVCLYLLISPIQHLKENDEWDCFRAAKSFPF